ncbi:MAG: restriction endonuclease, partial [Paludibacteraceae bacterium]|nr:restriction endonuclease [Paludibacteraceae bacterium]
MTKSELQLLFQHRYDRNVWSDFLHSCIGVERLLATPKGIVVPAAESSRDMKGWLLGEFETPDNYKIGLFEFSVTGNQASRRRVGLRNILVPWLKSGDFDAAIAVFHSTETPIWRVSFICDLKGATTAAKRFTFAFGDSASQYRTAVTRFASLGGLRSSASASFSAIREAFSVEALSKEFYAELYDWYSRAISEAAGVYFPNDPENN